MPDEKTSKSDDSSTDYIEYVDLPPSLEDVQLGVWRIILERKSPLKIPKWEEFYASVAAVKAYFLHLAPFFKDIYSVVGPALAFQLLLAHCWHSVQEAVYLYLSSNLLNTVRRSLIRGLEHAF